MRNATITAVATTFWHDVDAVALWVVVPIVCILGVVGIAVLRRHRMEQRRLNPRRVRARQDVIRRNLDRMAEYLDRLHESDPAVWHPFENGLAAMAACQWDQAIEYFQKAKAKASGAQFVPIYNQTGVCRYIQGHPDEALSDFEEAARLARQHGDECGEAPALANIGVIHHEYGDLDGALKQLREALVLARKCGDERSVAPYLVNIGNVYSDRGEPDKALKFYQDALAISRAIGDRRCEASCLDSIGSNFCDKDELRSALSHYEKALAVSRETEDRRGMASYMSRIGSIHRYRGELDEALLHFEGALALEREMGYQTGLATELANIGLILVDKGLHVQAALTLAESLGILLSIGVARGPRQALYGLSRCDDRLGRERVLDLLKEDGFADASIADIMDRVDQMRLRRPRPMRARRPALVPRRQLAGAR